jgi:nicotinate dehydrogenase subunit B
MKKEEINYSRRTFLKSSGYLMLGFSIFPAISCKEENAEGLPNYQGIPERPQSGNDQIDSWIRLDSKGHATILTGKQELGQGVSIALLQIAADELELDIAQCHLIKADTGQTANEGYTAGSNSIESSGRAIRRAASEAKHILIQMAAKKYQIDPKDIQVANGNLSFEDKSISYWELLEGKKIEQSISGEAPLVNPEKYNWVGKPILRRELELMVRGKQHFIHDLRMDGMLHARVIHPPSYQEKLLSANLDNLDSGKVQIHRDGNFIGVVGNDEYQVIKVWEKIHKEAKWEANPLSIEGSGLKEYLNQKSQSPEIIQKSDGIIEKISNSSIFHSAEYFKPYIMHGSTGPSCAIALWENEQLTVWTPTQGVYPLQATLADLLQISPDQIRCIGIPGSGCYGHNGADDVSAEAALLAHAFPGKPIRLQWMREDEHLFEPYGPAMLMKLYAGLNKEGKIQAFRSEIYSDSHSTRPRGDAGNFISARVLNNPFKFQKGGFSGGAYRNAPPLYEVKDYQLELYNNNGPLRTSALRGLGAYANIFALEAFIDELASIAQVDPFEFRIKNLSNQRAISVLERLRDQCRWTSKNEKEKAFTGLAFAQYKNTASYFAVLAELEPSNSSRKYRLKKLTGVIDSGKCINPDGLKNQTEGGMIQSASWTLMEEVNFDSKGTQSKDWASYPILRSERVPELEVHIIDRPLEDALGAGEAAQGPTAAAIVNALSSVLGERVRDLPLKAYFE